MHEPTLLIVESPNKIKTISKYLPSHFKIAASVGHVRDLPKSSMGLDDNLTPQYEITKPDVVKKLRSLAKSVKNVVLLTDADREGEAIAWHLAEILNLKENYQRCETIALNKSGILNALKNPRRISLENVRSQEARRVLDRIIGYKVSRYTQTLLKLPAAGRVQSVALRLIVERHKLIQQFAKSKYFELCATHPAKIGEWNSILDTDSLLRSGRFDDCFTPKMMTESGSDAVRHVTNIHLIQTIQQEVFNRRKLTVVSFDKSPATRRSPPPFTTSSLLQAASSQLKMKTSKTMDIAQTLFEQGLITYHRTDSTKFDPVSITMIRDFISAWEQNTGKTNYLPKSAQNYSNGDAAQEGHEAIRPCDLNLDINSITDKEQRAVYELIFRRTIASQMAPATFQQTRVTLSAGFKVSDVEVLFKASTRSLEFDGWMTIYHDSESDEKQPESLILPDLLPGEDIPVKNLEIEKKSTKPPPRYTDATLIKALEKKGVGRPSTYASILEGLHHHTYISYEARFIEPTKGGIQLVNSLVSYFGFMDPGYTGNMESQIDKIARGQMDYFTIVSRANEDLDRELSSFMSEAGGQNSIMTCPVCDHNTLVQQTSKAGKLYWSCLRDKCDAYYPDSNNTPNLDYRAPVDSPFACPDCSSPLRQSKEKNGKRWYYCSKSRKKSCDFVCPSSGLDDNAKPDLSIWERSHMHKCPKTNCSTFLKSIRTKRNPRNAWICPSSKCDTFLEDFNGSPNYKLYEQKHGNKVIPRSDEELNDKRCQMCDNGYVTWNKTNRYFQCTNCHAVVEADSNGNPYFEGLKARQRKRFI